jgi:hypothetical protein
LNIIQGNTCFLWVLGSSYQFLTNVKISNELLKNLFIKDKNNIKEITKQLIINEIMSNENLNDYTNINNVIFDLIKGVFGEEKIEELLLSMTNKTLTRNKKAKFSIKDEYLKYLDISSIYNYKEKSSIQKYINNFKKEKISVYNTYFYPFSKYEVNLQNNIFQNFFINQENFDITFKMTELLLNNEKYIIFQQFFLSELINYWNIFFYVYEKNIDNEQYNFFINKNKNTIEKLINVLRNNSLNDISLKDYCLITKKNNLFNNIIDNGENIIKYYFT